VNGVATTPRVGAVAFNRPGGESIVEVVARFAGTELRSPPIRFGSIGFVSQLRVGNTSGGAEVRWDGPAVLETRASLVGGTWLRLETAVSPYSPPAADQGFYRVTSP